MPWTTRQPIGRAGAATVRSAALAHWRAPDQSLDLVTGALSTFTRNATRAVLTTAGATVTLPRDVPGWEVRGGLLGLRMGTDDRLSWAWGATPQAMSGRLVFIETGARVVEGRCLWSISNDAATGARLWLDTSGTYYRINYNDGTTPRTATLTAGTPTTGQTVALRWRLAADGALTLWQSVNSAAETTASAAALALPEQWGSGARLRLNSLGTGTGGDAWYRQLQLGAGVIDAADVAVLF